MMLKLLLCMTLAVGLVAGQDEEWDEDLSEKEKEKKWQKKKAEDFCMSENCYEGENCLFSSLLLAVLSLVRRLGRLPAASSLSLFWSQPCFALCVVAGLPAPRVCAPEVLPHLLVVVILFPRLGNRQLFCYYHVVSIDPQELIRKMSSAACALAPPE